MRAVAAVATAGSICCRLSLNYRAEGVGAGIEMEADVMLEKVPTE